MSRRGYRNKKLREQNKPEIFQFCKDNSFAIRAVAGDWQFRIENVIDVYPTRKRFFWLPTQEWGSYEDYDDLGRIMLERMVTS